MRYLLIFQAREMCYFPNLFAAHFLSREVWFSFSKTSKNLFYLAKFDFPFPRHQKATLYVIREAWFSFSKISKSHFIIREVRFSFSKISKKHFLSREFWFFTTHQSAQFGHWCKVCFYRYSKLIFIGAQIENLRAQIDIFRSPDKLIFDASNVNFGAQNENFGVEIDIFWCP